VAVNARGESFEIMLTIAIVSFILVDPGCVYAANRGHHPIVDSSQHFVTKDE
jgi:hypothetical protein